jgi:hypothetical protein
MKPRQPFASCRFWIGFSAFVILGCVIPVDRARKTDREMNQRIIALVPVGTPIAEARKKMEENGFRCSSEQNGEPEPGKLHCSIDKSMNWAVTTTWVADLSFDERGLVTDVAIRSWATGP